MGILDTITADKAIGELGACLGPRILDVRTSAEFESEHIEDSLHVPLDQLEERLGELPADKPLLVVCRSGARAARAAELLGKHRPGVRVLDGGILAWERAGLPLRKGRAHLPLDRQVQLIVGASVLAGVVLGTWLHQGLLALAAGFGAGLIFAGLTGSCPLSTLVAKAPWNRKRCGT